MRNNPNFLGGISIGNLWRFVGCARVVISGFFCYSGEYVWVCFQDYAISDPSYCLRLKIVPFFVRWHRDLCVLVSFCSCIHVVSRLPPYSFLLLSSSSARSGRHPRQRVLLQPHPVRGRQAPGRAGLDRKNRRFLPVRRRRARVLDGLLHQPPPPERV